MPTTAATEMMSTLAIQALKPQACFSATSPPTPASPTDPPPPPTSEAFSMQGPTPFRFPTPIDSIVALQQRRKSRPPPKYLTPRDGVLDVVYAFFDAMVFLMLRHLVAFVEVQKQVTSGAGGRDLVLKFQGAFACHTQTLFALYLALDKFVIAKCDGKPAVVSDSIMKYGVLRRDDGHSDEAVELWTSQTAEMHTLIADWLAQFTKAAENNEWQTEKCSGYRINMLEAFSVAKESVHAIHAPPGVVPWAFHGLPRRFHVAPAQDA
ncbi:hypothetical protein JKP88DRAFT_267422 [Tribonema minus]|uniref:Uncharacterized protein n=1 Tax=Tribonema minus TaxID=303371 RepID=A0A835Z776_9STRA|nr:hypothetical protein JKP88DRAFT_267422 [Tribonema minus]